MEYQNVDAQDDLRRIGNSLQDTIGDMIRMESALIDVGNCKLAERVMRNNKQLAGYLNAIREIANSLA